MVVNGQIYVLYCVFKKLLTFFIKSLEMFYAYFKMDSYNKLEITKQEDKCYVKYN